MMHSFSLFLCIQLIGFYFASSQCLEKCSDTSQSPVLLQRTHSSMKAVRLYEFGGPEVLKYEKNVPIPSIGSEDVLIRVKAIGVNPVETYIRSGQHSQLPKLPFVLGGDSAGIVEDVGTGVTGFRKGDHVFTFTFHTADSGAYAEYISVSQQFVQPLPDVLTFNQGAALGVPYLTAYRALITIANARPGEVILVHGASGGVGIATVQFAKAYGMTVIGTAGTAKGMDLVKKAGAHHVFNHHQDDYIDKLKEISAGNGLNVIIENAAHANLGRDLQLLAMGGRVIVVGSRGPIEVNPRDTMARESSVMGVMLYNASGKELKESLAALQAGIHNGWLRPIVGKLYNLENAPECHQDIIHGKGALGKSVLTVE